jgi:hypothetical protein
MIDENDLLWENNNFRKRWNKRSFIVMMIAAMFGMFVDISIFCDPSTSPRVRNLSYASAAVIAFSIVVVVIIAISIRLSIRRSSIVPYSVPMPVLPTSLTSSTYTQHTSRISGSE